jgi:hypothetical protein
MGLLLVHMHNFSLHRQDKEHNPITYKYSPEYRNIEYREDGHDKAMQKAFVMSYLKQEVVG